MSKRAIASIETTKNLYDCQLPFHIDGTKNQETSKVGRFGRNGWLLSIRQVRHAQGVPVGDLGVVAAVESMATSVETLVGARAFMIETPVGAVAFAIEPRIDTRTLAVELPVDAISFAIESFCSDVVAICRRAVGSTIEPVVDAISLCVESILNAIALGVEPIVNPITSGVEVVLDAVAPGVQMIFHPVSHVGVGRPGGEGKGGRDECCANIHVVFLQTAMEYMTNNGAPWVWLTRFGGNL